MDVKTVVKAFDDCVQARIEFDKARDAYEGLHWDSIGNRLEHKMEQAAAEFGDALAQYVDERVAAALAKRDAAR